MESSAWPSSDDEPSPPDLPNRNADKGPALLAKTESLGFLRMVVALELGVEVRRNELELRVAAIDAKSGSSSLTIQVFCTPMANFLS